MLSDLSALLPPLLVAVVILVAVGAFLKHEMGRGRRDSGDSFPGDSNGDSVPPGRDSDG